MAETAHLPWLDSYPESLRWDTELATGPVNELLDQSAQRFADNPAIDFLGHKISYRELDRLVSRAAAGLQRLGVGPGVHVGLFLPNSPHYFIGFFGVLRAGGTVVNYSPLDAERTLAHKIEDSETDIMLTLDLESLYPRMAGMLGNSRLRHLVVGQLTEFCGPVSAAAAGQLGPSVRSEEHTSELQSRPHLVCRLLLEKKKKGSRSRAPSMRYEQVLCLDFALVQPPLVSMTPTHG